MNLESVLSRLDLERRTFSPDGVIEVLPLVTRQRSADGRQHCIISSSLTLDNVDSVIAEQIAHYRAMGAGVEWKVYAHDKPADLLQRLSRKSFEIGPMETVLVLDLHDRPAWMDESMYLVQRVESLKQVDLFREAATEIFRKDYQFTAGELAAGIRAGSTNHLGYIAMEGNVAASIGRLYTHRQSEFGGLYGGGTRKSGERRRIFGQKSPIRK